MAPGHGGLTLACLLVYLHALILSHAAAESSDLEQGEDEGEKFRGYWSGNTDEPMEDTQSIDEGDELEVFCPAEVGLSACRLQQWNPILRLPHVDFSRCPIDRLHRV